MSLIMYSPAFTQNSAALDGIDASTVLMLHANDFTDSSIYNVTVTSNATIDTANFTMGQSSFHFNSSTFTIPSSSNYQFGLTDFTIDFWMNQPTSAAQYLCGATDSNKWYIGIDVTGVLSFSIFTNNTTPILGHTQVTDGTWHHIALVRHGNAHSFYVDGVLDFTVTISNANWTAGQLKIGGYTTQNYTGWMQEFRISNGIARWLSTFIPRTIPYQSVGTGADIYNVLLLHFDVQVNHSTGNYVYKDSSPSNNVVEAFNDTFTITDSSSHTFAITTVGTPKGTLVSPFSTGGTSIVLNGTTDYYTCAISPSFTIGLGSFTIEAWINISSLKINPILSNRFASNNTSYNFSVTSTGYLQFNTGVTGSNFTQTTGPTIAVNSWTHVAAVRSGTTFQLYINGVSVYTTNISTNFSLQQGLSIGSDGQGTRTYFAGYISNLRFVNGTAVYTSNFTPSTINLTAVANTALLLTCTKTSIPIKLVEDYTYGKFLLGVNYGADVGYIEVPTSSLFNFGILNWTIDFWAKLNLSTGTNTFFCTGYNNQGVSLNYNGVNFNLIIGNGTSYTTYSLPYSWNILNWHHIGLTRVGKTYSLWVDGILLGSFLITVKIVEAANPFLIGSDYTDIAAYRINGYLDEFRVSKNVIRYDENFVPWTIPYGGFPTFPTLTATWPNVASASSGTTQIASSVINGMIIPLPISISSSIGSSINGNATYSLDGVNYTGAVGLVDPGTTVYLKIIASNISLATVTVTVTLGNTQTGITTFNWTVTSLTPTLTANFTNFVDVPYSTVKITSSVISGMVVPLPIRLTTNGNIAAYSLDGVNYTTTTGTINPGQTVYLQMTSSASSLVTLTTSLNVGDNIHGGVVSFPWTVKTLYSIIDANLLLLVNNGPGTSYNYQDSANGFGFSQVGTIFGSSNRPYATSTNGSILLTGTSWLIGPSVDLVGDFTIEGWFYPSGTIGGWFGIGVYGQLPSGSSIDVRGVSNGPYTYWGPTAPVFGTHVVSQNAWHHLAITRHGTTSTLWIDGANVGTSAAASQRITVSGSIGIGRNVNDVWTGFSGNIADFRVVDGTAVYTANFSVPTSPLTVIPGTVVLLQCPASPVGEADYVDRSLNQLVPTVYGTNMSIGSPQFSYNSIVYGGTANGYLKFNNSVLGSVTGGDFSMEAEVYNYGGWPANSGIIAAQNAGGGGVGILTSGANIQFVIGTASSWNWISSGYAVSSGVWLHCVMVRHNGVGFAFINGILVAVTANVQSMSYSSWAIGARFADGNSPLTNTIIGNVAYRKLAVYGIFNPPTVPYTTDANTTVLLTGAGTTGTSDTIYDLTGRHGISNTNVYCLNNMFFNGYNTYLAIGYTSDFYIGSGDFTIEGLIYWDGALTAGINMPLWGQNSTTNNNLRISLNTTTGQLIANSTGVTLTAPVASKIVPYTWYHVAFQKCATTWTLYINGASVVQSVVATIAPNMPSNNFWIGCIDPPSAVATNPCFNGMMNSIRFSNVARYGYWFANEYTSDANTLFLLQYNVHDSSSFARPVSNPKGSAGIDGNQGPTTTDISLYFSPGTQLTVPATTGTAASSMRLQLATLTIECWIKWESVGSIVFAQTYDPVTGANWAFYYNAGYIIFDHYGASVSYSFTPIANVWYNFAVAKNSATSYMYLNGVLQSSGGGFKSSAFPTVTTGTNMFMGEDYYGSWTSSFWMSDLRISNIVRTGYTAAFYIIPKSVTVSNFSPYSTLPATDSNTMLAIPGNTGTDTIITDLTGNTWHTIGMITISPNAYTSYPGLYFDGAGGYAYSDNLPQYSLGTADWTIEFWIYWISSGTGDTIISNYTTSTNPWWKLTLSSAGALVFTSVLPTVNAPIGTISANTWHFVSISRHANVINASIDGVAIAANIITATANLETTGYSILKLGGTGEYNSGSGQLYGTAFRGYLFNFRMSNSALYNHNFVPPIADYN